MCNNILNENKITFKDIESEIYKVVCDVACSAIKEVLQHLDRRLMNERDTKVLRNKGVKHTCIKTIMGNVEFDRRIYEFHTEDGKKAYKFLLDEHLQMESIGFMSVNLVEKMVSNVANLSYRKSAKNIEEMSNQSISHTAVWNVIQKLGDNIKEHEKNKIIKNKCGQLKGKKESKVILQEADGVFIYMQGKDRPKRGKSKKKELKLGVFYEGFRKRNESSDEYEVINKIAYSTFGSSKDFKELGEATLAENYNTDEIDCRVINGDGAKWIKEIAASEGVIFQLDPFHRSQAIVKAIKDKKESKQLMELFNEGKVNDGLGYLTNLLIKYNSDENRFKKLEDLYNYLVSNKDGLVPYKLREDVKLPTPPAGVEYRNLGTMEHNICDILAQRFKGRKMSWSENGASNLAKILTELTNKNIYNFIASQYNKLVSKEVLSSFEELVVLTPEAVDRHIKKSKVYKTKRGKVPYDGYATTEGRKAIQNLVRNRVFSDLGFK